jgi:hypothetical protein
MAESTSTPSAAQRPAGSTPSAALELYNHIVENANYLICGNENCRQKNFVHQQGRKKTGTAAAESFIAPTQIGAYPGHAPAEARAAT